MISPSVHMSEGYAFSRLLNPQISGAKYLGVPVIVVVCPRPSSTRFVIPKSASLIHQSCGGYDSIRMF
jgi:hypothetical protein